MATLKRLSPAPTGLVAAPDPGLHPARLKIIAYCLVSKKKKKYTGDRNNYCEEAGIKKGVSFLCACHFEQLCYRMATMRVGQAKDYHTPLSYKLMNNIIIIKINLPFTLYAIVLYTQC